MKDLSLSILSRGCGRLVASSGISGGRDGRLHVCFTPQDYGLCEQKETLLRLSSSGRLFAEAASTVPKTYSTRRGALLLYSQELVTLETNPSPDVGVRKKRVIRRDTQQMKRRLSSLKKLTAAILSYSNNQSISSTPAPPLNLPPTLHRSSPASAHATEAPASPSSLVRSNQQWLPAKTPAAVKAQDEGTERGTENASDKEEQTSERVRVDVFVQMPRSPRSPTPQPWLHYVATGPDKAEQQQSYVDAEGIRQDPNTKGDDDATDGPGASLRRGRNPGDEDDCGKSRGLLLRQKATCPVFDGLRWEETDERCQVSSSDEHQPHRLPPIAEGRTVTESRGHRATQGDASQENTTRLNKQPLVLPLLFPEAEEPKQRKGREKTKKHFKNAAVATGGGGGRLPSEKGSGILLEPHQEPSPHVVVMGGVAGWKGPGKQSSFAFLQNLRDPSDSGLVRGLLPLELRDFHNDRAVGCLILGPDGEIIQVSLSDSGRGSMQGDNDSQQQALQVLSPEGEELPWVIVLQPEPHSDRKLQPSSREPESDVPRPVHTDFVQGFIQGTESHFVHTHSDDENHGGTLGQFRLTDPSFSTELILSVQHSDLPGSTETDASPPRGHTDKVIMKSKNAEEALKTWKGAKTSDETPPLREQRAEEELRGGSTDEDKGEDEELSITDQKHHLYESHQPRFGSLSDVCDQAAGFTVNVSDSPIETPTRDVDRRRKKEVTEEDATTSGKSETTPDKSLESNEQRRRKRKDKKWQKPQSDDVQSIRGLRHDGSTREAAATQDLAAASPMKKRIKNRGELKMNEEREDQESARQKVSAGRRTKRSRRSTHKELVIDSPPENEDVGSHQEMQADPHRPTSAARTADGDSDTDDPLASDQRSCVQSVSSLRSSVASSQYNPRSSVRSLGSFYERTASVGTAGLAPSRGRLSSCSTVMITEEQLMLNPVKPELTKGQEEEEAAAQHQAQRAERRRQEEERKRRQREEEERKQKEKEQTEERMKNELEEERRKRAEELRLRKLAEEEERRTREEEERERARREQAQRERERRRQEEMRRQIELLHRMREQEEQRRRAELERLRLEEKKKQEEEDQKLQEMDEAERTEYLRRKEQEEEERRKEKEELERRQQEAARLAAEEAELLVREMALLQQQLAFKRDLMLEAGGLEKTQGISRPWIYSYFTLLQLLGPSSGRAVTKTP